MAAFSQDELTSFSEPEILGSRIVSLVGDSISKWGRLVTFSEVGESGSNWGGVVSEAGDSGGKRDGLMSFSGVKDLGILAGDLGGLDSGSE